MREKTMPLCIDTYKNVETFFDNQKIRVNKRICRIYMCDEGERILSGGPTLIDYTVSMRKPTTLKTAYVKIGSASLGWFTSTPTRGIYIEEIQIPEPFEWVERWPSIDKLVDCDIAAKIREEFWIRIEEYI